MLNIIVAISKNNCIGKDNKLPWHLPEDLKHFKKITSGKTVLMGRKTFESILGYLGKPLPKRKNIVITRNKDYKIPKGVEVYTDLNKAIEKYRDEEIFVIGGSSIYAQAMDLADKLYITHVDMEVDGDAFFPKINSGVWEEENREDHEGYAFANYIKSS